MKLAQERINIKKQQLAAHPMLSMNMIQSIEDLRVFMEYHVYAVWDFMSLAKALQHHVCPSTELWLPISGTRNENARLINEIILCEESDKDLGGGSISHFDLYIQAMHEVGADTSKILDLVQDGNINRVRVPKAAYDFMKSTFDFIDTKQPHVVAAAFCHGRETVIPDMFKGILNQLQIKRTDAPKFYYYLERHIEVDGDDHGPAAYKLAEDLCYDNPLYFVEAERAAVEAIDARIKFWDGVEEAILENNSLN